jgi:hypothetical protein
MLRLGLDRQLALLAGCGGGCYLDRFGAGVVVPLDVASVVDQPAAVPWVHADRIGLAHGCPLCQWELIRVPPRKARQMRLRAAPSAEPPPGWEQASLTPRRHRLPAAAACAPHPPARSSTSEQARGTRRHFVPPRRPLVNVPPLASGVAPERFKGCIDRNAVGDAELALRLLDHDPASQRALQLRHLSLKSVHLRLSSALRTGTSTTSTNSSLASAAMARDGQGRRHARRHSL